MMGFISISIANVIFYLGSFKTINSTKIVLTLLAIVCCISLNFWLHVQHTFTHTHARNNCILVKGLWFSIPSNDSNQMYHVCSCFYFYLATIGRNRAFSSRYLLFFCFHGNFETFSDDQRISNYIAVFFLFSTSKMSIELIKAHDD